MDTFMDFKTAEDRKAGYVSFKLTVARGFVFLGLGLSLVLFIATAFINLSTAQVEARDAIASIRYENIKH